ncbi:phage tail protein [Janthinobacterium sp. SUN100]|uniref:phage tail protein n=1 Tax=Janthinobacterium sp. SUN100 TaxID=3004101 RepID=UPI0025AFBD42|nr:phage tail protein [Janthinobacterium sp. SUN100]MDN2703454.1 phage tail protein [Janthinobacterium sp. SUN100]
MSTYFAILTEVGEAKLANAIALGQTLKLKNLAVGDGNGNLPMPSRTQKALVHEVRRAGLNQLSIDPTNTSQIIVEQVLPEDVGGWWIREIGIFDEAGDLCAVANCPPSYKPVMAEGSARTQVVRIVLIVASTAAIELKIDPSVILATRKYVDDQDITVRAYSDAQLGRHLAAVDPHPLLAKLAYVDQQDGKVAIYADQQLAKHLAAADPHPLLAKVAYVDQQDSSARAYGDQQLAKHQAAADPHPLLAKVAYVDQQDTSARTYCDQQLAKHQAATDPHPLLAKVTYVDQQDTNARAYGDQQLAKHQAAADPHPLLAKVAYVDQQDTSARAYGDQQLAKHQAAADPHPLLAKVTYVDQQDASARAYGDQQLAKHQAAADPHPLLAKVAYVDQQDTSARTYGDQQLARHAAAADPHPQYKPKAGENLSGLTQLNSTATITPVQCAGMIEFFGTGTFSVNLPLISALPNGQIVEFANFSGGIVNLLRQGADFIFVNQSAPQVSLTMAPGDTLRLIATTIGWMGIGGSAQLQFSSSFSSSLTPNGYKQLPGGYIEQWGVALVSAANVATPVTFPIPFTSAVLQVVTAMAGAAPPGAIAGTDFQPGATTQFSLFQGSASQQAMRWRAIGK